MAFSLISPHAQFGLKPNGVVYLKLVQISHSIDLHEFRLLVHLLCNVG